MTFLILSQYFPPEIGAAQTRLLAISKELQRHGHAVEVVTAMPNHLTRSIFKPYRGRFYIYETIEGVPVHRTWVYVARISKPMNRLINYVSFAVTALWALTRVRKPDYIFVESPPPVLFMLAWFYGIIRNVPVILNVSDMWPDALVKLKVLNNGVALRACYNLEAWSYKKARFVNAVSEGNTQILKREKEVPADKILYLPNGVDISFFSPKPADSDLLKTLGLEGKKVFLYAGTHGIVYQLDLILKVAEKLLGEPIVFLLVGDGFTKRHLVSAAESRGLTNIVFIDPQPLERMPHYFSISTASVVPLTKSDLFDTVRPAKIFPSLACGVPVIYCGQGEGANIIRRADAGIIVPAGDANAFYEAVLMLSQNTALQEKYGKNGRRYVAMRDSWEGIVNSWLVQLARCQANPDSVSISSIQEANDKQASSKSEVS